MVEEGQMDVKEARVDVTDESKRCRLAFFVLRWAEKKTLKKIGRAPRVSLSP